MPSGEITPSSWSAGCVFHGKQDEGGEFNYNKVVREAVESANQRGIYGTAEISKKWLAPKYRQLNVPSTFVIQSDSIEMFRVVFAEVQRALQRIDRQLAKPEAGAYGGASRLGLSADDMPPVSSYEPHQILSLSAHEPLPMPGDLYLTPARAAPYHSGALAAAGGGGGGGGGGGSASASASGSSAYRPPHIIVPRPGSMAYLEEYDSARTGLPAPRPPLRSERAAPALLEVSSSSASVISDVTPEVPVLTATRKLQIAAAKASSAHIDECLAIYLEVMRDPASVESVISETRQALLNSVTAMERILRPHVLLMPPRANLPNPEESKI